MRILFVIAVVISTLIAAMTPAEARASTLLPDVGTTQAMADGTPFTFNVTMPECGLIGLGTTGTCVASLQTLLDGINDAGLTVDGSDGPLTSAAVRAFQQRNGLSADGVVGSDTRQALLEQYRATRQLAPEPTPGAAATNIVTATPRVPGLGRYRIGFFIRQSSYGALGKDGAGDGRSFDPRMSSGDNRIYVDVDFDQGTTVVVLNPSCNVDRTSCTNPIAITEDRVHVWTEDFLGSPTNTVNVHLSVENSREGLGIVNVPISASLQITPAPQGGACVSGSISSFPSAEIYHDDSSGVTTTLYTHEQRRLIGAAALAFRGLDTSVLTCG